MYMHGYEDAPPQLNGFFSKVFKKVFKPALHIGAAVFTGGASIPLSANYLAQKKAQEAAQKMADDQAKQEMAVIAAQERLALMKVSQEKPPSRSLPARRSSIPQWVVPAAASAVVVAAIVVATRK